MQARARILTVLIILAALAALAAGILAGTSGASGPAPAPGGVMRTTTGPTPPPRVRPPAHARAVQDIQDQVVVPGVPAYIWHDGCGPTSLGMIVGYYDGHGFDALIPGDASQQTTAVSQAIASHQVAGGGPEHYEDYSVPLDYGGPIVSDKSELPAGDEHADDCIADFMDTSRSADGLTYGSSWTNDVGPAFKAYVAGRIPGATVTYSDLRMGSSLTWNVLTGEIDAGRPMVFLVDSSGDGQIDHAVAAIGYRLNGGTEEYACWDTWYSTIRWSAFRPVSSAYTFGVWGATALSVSAASPSPQSTTSSTPASGPSPTTSPSPAPDTTPPVTAVLGADSAWHAGPVMLTFSATDLQSGVARTETRVNDAPSWTTGDSLLVTGQGVHTVDYRSVDQAQNVEAQQACAVKIDAVGPRVSVASATVKRGRTAIVRFRVADLTPQVHVRLVTATADGKQLRAIGIGVRSTGVRHACRIPCSLRRGRYHLVMRATDLAGNRQIRAGVARLVVR